MGKRDFPVGPVVKNPSCNARNVGLIPGWGTKTHMPQSNEALGLQLLSWYTTARESMRCNERFCMKQQRLYMPTTKTDCSQMNFLKRAKDITKEDNIKWPVSTWKNVQHQQ